MLKDKRVTIIGAGLAGCEAAWQLAQRNIPVRLCEMRPEQMTPAHKTGNFAELVCSNSLRSDRLENAVGLLKEEMRLLDSLIMQAADHARVPAGGALAVDREDFSGFITARLSEHPMVEVAYGECTELPEGPVIIAAGPLASDALGEVIARDLKLERMHFFDAAAPIVLKESLNMDIIFPASRYGRGEDYLNCPMTEEQYFAFYEALIHAQEAPVHGFEDQKVFEGCMPVEVMAKRGPQTLAYGPLKPIGLRDPRTGARPYAVVQLRQDDREGRLYNLVGFQTHLKFGEQKRVFSMIPGLENAEFVRYGVMHRNTYIHSPGVLSAHYQMLARPDVFFAGQITGVEGYVESAASGLVAGRGMAAYLLDEPVPEFGDITAIGALGHYVSSYAGSDFQPMNANFGIMRPLEKRIRNKKEKNLAIAQRALEHIKTLV